METLQQQQRAEKDATLAELEESRKIFIRRLKQHRGREWKVINDALSFAGEPEPQQEDIDLPLPSYPMQLAFDPAAFAKFDVPDHENINFKQFSLMDEEVRSDHGIFSVFDEDFRRMVGSEAGEGSPCRSDTERPVAGNGCLFRGLSNRVFRFFKSRVGKASGKALLLLAGAAAVTYGRQRNVGPGRGAFRGPRTATEFWQKSNKYAYSPGRWGVLQDGVQKRVQRDRIEVPFRENGRSPNVSHG